MFNNPIIESTLNQLNGTSFSLLGGFGMYSSSDTVYYYVMDLGAWKVYNLNDEWEFITFKTFTYPIKMISISSALYLTGYFNVWKVDKDLNILIEYNPGDKPYYLGIRHNPLNNLICVLARNLYEIRVFNLDLTLIRRFSTSSHEPWSITESSNKLYVGTRRGIIFVYQNEIIIKQFNGCDENIAGLSSLLFDQNGYMVSSCSKTNNLYLFSPNGSFTGKSLITPIDSEYIGFDSKGRFIQISENQISIYKPSN